MRTILHILTQNDDALARAIIDNQRALPDVQLSVVELPKVGADYESLVDKIFAADSVEVW